jgi:hypothetical protein
MLFPLFPLIPYCFIISESDPHPIEGLGRFRYSSRRVYIAGTAGTLASKIGNQNKKWVVAGGSGNLVKKFPSQKT